MTKKEALIIADKSLVALICGAGFEQTNALLHILKMPKINEALQDIADDNEIKILRELRVLNT